MAIWVLVVDWLLILLKIYEFIVVVGVVDFDSFFDLRVRLSYTLDHLVDIFQFLVNVFQQLSVPDVERVLFGDRVALNSSLRHVSVERMRNTGLVSVRTGPHSIPLIARWRWILGFQMLNGPLIQLPGAAHLRRSLVAQIFLLCLLLPVCRVLSRGRSLQPSAVRAPFNRQVCVSLLVEGRARHRVDVVHGQFLLHLPGVHRSLLELVRQILEL